MILGSWSGTSGLKITPMRGIRSFLTNNAVQSIEIDTWAG